MKVIFLDIDGVMNSALGKGEYIADMEANKLKLLHDLIVETESEGIVLTSDRRFSILYMNKFIDALDKYEIYLVDVIRDPSDDEDNRGKQILDYINKHKDITKFVILDDNDEGISNYFNEEFILVDKYHGLDEEIYHQVAKLLK